MLRKALVAVLTATLLATGSGSKVPEGKPACKPRYLSSSGMLASATTIGTAQTFTPGLSVSGIVSGGSSSVSRRPIVSSGGGGDGGLTALSSGDFTALSGSASIELSASGHASGSISGYPSLITSRPPVGHPVAPSNSTHVSGSSHVSAPISGHPAIHTSGLAHISGHASAYPSVHASGSGHISGPVSGYPSITRRPVSGPGLPVASETGSASGAVSAAFLLQAQGTQETTVDGFYLTLVSNGDGTYHGEFKASIDTAQKFILRAGGSLTTLDGTLVAVVAYQGAEFLDEQLFVPASAINTVSVAGRRSRQASFQYYEDVCVANANATLTCSLPVWPSGIFQVPQGGIILEIGSQNESSELILYIVPVGSATTTGTAASSTLRSTLSSMTSLASSASPTSCGPPGPTLLPVANTDIDRSSISNLEPSMNATLNYAEAYPGTQALSLYLTMAYKQVTLENSALISVTCSGDNLIVTANNNDTQQYIMNMWGSANLVLFTNTAGCNNATSRGVYYVNGAFATRGTLDTTFVVASTDFSSVAEAVAIKYGSVNYPSTVGQAASSTAYTSTCSETGSPLPTASMATDSSIQMDQNSINYYLALKSAIQYDSDGNIVGHPSNPTNLTVPVASFDPTNTTEQAALEQALENMGLSPPSSLASEAAQALQSTESSSSSSSGTCNAAIPKKRSPTPTVPRAGLPIRKRLSWDQFTDYACDDDIDDMLGIFGEDVENGVEAACGINDLAENGDSLKCLFSNCYTTTTIITYYTPPPATKYDFDYSWNVQFPPIEQDVVYDKGNTVSCVNCGFSISNLEFSGEIIINMTAGTIDEAKISADMSGVATMIAGIDSSEAWSGNWSYIYSTTTLDAITLDNAFKIIPTILYGIGINYETDSAVSTSGGAQFSLDNAQVSMDLLTSTITSKSNWQPSIVFTNPSFTTGANIQLTPYMRWAVELSVSIFGVTFLSPRITSETVVGLDSTYSFDATSSCPANRLGVTSYVSTTNSISDGSSAAQSLYTSQTYGNTQCFDVPSNQPSPEEIVELAASGGAFCTSYINYNPATVYSWTTSTSTAPSSIFHSSTTTVTVTSTPTVTLSPTEVITTWLGPYTEYATTVTADTTIATVYSMDSSLLKRGFIGKEPPLPALTAGPVTAEQSMQRRAVATPSVAASWSASEISYACSQVATGKVTVTSTQGTTVTSGVSTDVLTITANADGPVQTVTSTQTSYVYGGVSITTVAATATSTPMSCPFENEVPSCGCMVVTLHGASYMEGLQLRYDGFTSSPAAIPSDDYSGYIWYLSSRGWLTTLTWDYGASYPSFLGGYTHSPMEAMNYYSADISDQFFEPAVCTKDPSTMTLDCKLAGYGPMYAQPESVATSTLYDNPEEDEYLDYGISMPKYIDAQVQIPYWTLGQNLTGYTPLTLSYEEIDCLCNAWIP